ncbi:uncharacterized protein FTOL_10469 [Fusarium torulosum]|uniref:Uncharacterized protein n=1 Tax=Fusarium torulosum TaxID=33205 RepID=A0AAE8MHZ2_9HYPO|nr:uncharacterized protein FTOL_10469 [Fusarium torulosum]
MSDIILGRNEVDKASECTELWVSICTT